jgi:predicted nucleic acid-binding Zn ribbon protein
MVDSGSKASINVRSSGYWIAHATGECDRCRAETRLVALALPPHHHSLALDWDIEEDEPVAYSWETAECSAFLFYVEYLPEQVRRRLQAASKGYGFAFSERAQGSYWANHCATCGALIEDHDLFCEPDGAFLPTTAATAAAVSLERVDESFEAGAIGYACDPQFLDSMVER